MFLIVMFIVLVVATIGFSVMMNNFNVTETEKDCSDNLSQLDYLAHRKLELTRLQIQYIQKDSDKYKDEIAKIDSELNIIDVKMDLLKKNYKILNDKRNTEFCNKILNRKPQSFSEENKQDELIKKRAEILQDIDAGRINIQEAERRERQIHEQLIREQQLLEQQLQEQLQEQYFRQSVNDAEYQNNILNQQQLLNEQLQQQQMDFQNDFTQNQMF